MRLFVHIGAHKTGTTSIQMAMAASAAALAEQGLFYPRCCWYGHAHHRLAFSLKNMRDRKTGDIPDFDNELGDLHRSLSQSRAPSALISSEEFFSLKEVAVQKLAHGLKSYQVEIIAFVRRPDELFLSSYNQKTKQPGNRFFKPIEHHLANPRAVAPDIEFFDHISKWAAQFGKDSVHLAVYEGRDVVETICETLRIDPRRLNRRTKAANQSVSGKTLELMRLLKSAGADPKIQKSMLAQAKAIYPPNVTAGKMAAKTRLQILNRFAKKNESLFRMLGVAENPYDPSHLRLAEEGAPETLSKQDLIEWIVRMMD